jgi:hypothetical protein
MSLTSIRRCAFALLAMSACLSTAHADEGPLHDRFTFDLGTYFMSSDTRVRVDELDGIGIGSTMHLEDTFGFEDETVFRLEGTWRFAQRHKLRAMYFSSTRTRTSTVHEVIEFGDASFLADASIKAKFDFDILELVYEYAFLRGDGYELGASVGVHNVEFNVGLSGEAVVDGGSISGSREENASADAPLPVIGLRATWRMGNSPLYLQAHAQYFDLDYGDFRGHLQDYQAGLLWRFSDHFGMGVAYNLFDTRVDADDGDDYRGMLDWKYEGVQIFLRAGF